MLFVYAMLTMAVLGIVLAVGRNKAPSVNVPAGLLTSYLVITALTTVRPLAASRRGRWLAVGGLVVALAVGLSMLTFGLETLATGGRHRFLAFPSFLFATVGLLGAAGDLRVLRSGARTGAPRLARRLWRMCLALFIASLSFSVQLPKFLPKPARIPALLVLPVVAVLATMLYWLWRVRFRRSPRGIVVARVAEAA
jgi:hypothetical protein